MNAPADQAAPPQSIEDRLYALIGESDDPPLSAAPDEEPYPTEAAQNDEPDADNPPAEEAVEIEFEGRKVSIPKFLEPAILKNADYTQKTQELGASARTSSGGASRPRPTSGLASGRPRRSWTIWCSTPSRKLRVTSARSRTSATASVAPTWNPSSAWGSRHERSPRTGGRKPRHR